MTLGTLTSHWSVDATLGRVQQGRHLRVMVGKGR